MQVVKYVKQPVAVSVVIMTDGKVIPKKIQWKDGCKYKIDKVCKVERAASTKVGGCGLRYTVMIEGLPHYLFDEEGRWFMEDQVITDVRG